MIEKEKEDDMGLGPDRAEHFTLWPYSRVWVVVNNLIAAKKLDGLTFEKGKEYSLIDLLNLEKDYKRNIDLQKGYISGLSTRPNLPFLSMSESQGLSLTANILARTLALSPCEITEWHTHTGIDEFTKYYFDKKCQITAHPIFTKMGTDATVYSSDETASDLRFIPKEKMRLRCKIMDIEGNEVELSSLLQVISDYPKSLTVRLTKPLLIRYGLETENRSDYSISLNPYHTQEDERIRPGFVREVRRGNIMVTREKVVAHYDTNGLYLP